MIKIYGLFLLIISIHTDNFFHQNDYKFVHDHMTADYYNKKWLGKFKILNTKFNRTTKTFGVDATVVKQLNKIQISFKTYRMTNNQYLSLAAMDYKIDACLVLKKNYMGVGDLTTLGNITQCPIKVGTYYSRNWKPSDDKCPPLVPLGNYKVTVHLLTINDEKLLTFTWYGSIEKKHIF